MMGQINRSEDLFHYFSIDQIVPPDHLLRAIDRHVDFGFARERTQTLYSETGRPSIDPEVLLRILLVGYLYGISSERRLVDEVSMHLAYRWFTGLGFEQSIPHHSTFSKNRHGRFNGSALFRDVFEQIVLRCIEAGLVEGDRVSVDGSFIAANASRTSRVKASELAEAAKVSKTVREYLAEVETLNPVDEPETESGDPDTTDKGAATATVSTTDPDACYTTKGTGAAILGYFDNYLIDNAHRVILDVEPTTARLSREIVAARTMVERIKARFGIAPRVLAADTSYGTGDFLTWVLDNGIEPHIPVLDRYKQTTGAFTRKDFRFVPEDNCYICPAGEKLVCVGSTRPSKSDIYRVSKNGCSRCSLKSQCTTGRGRTLLRHWLEPVRDRARQLATTDAYRCSQRERRRIESLFGELKEQINLRRLRLRRLRHVSEQMLMAATAQNIKRLVKHRESRNREALTA
jgi:transposase